MSNNAHDKLIERERYDRRAGLLLASDPVAALGPDGAAGELTELRTPYLVFEAHIARLVRPGAQVLDVCCGTGLHSLAAARAGAVVTVSDIAPQNIELARLRAARAGLQITGRAADAEALPWPEASFDLVTCAGSLSYVDLDKFLAELRRVLRPGGAFVFVDSLNHNPFYRFNRYVNYLRGRRSRATLDRMPTLATLERIRRDFPDLQASYHGVFTFLAPGLRLFGAARAAAWLDAGDTALPFLHRYAFKVVGVGRRPAAGGAAGQI